MSNLEQEARTEAERVIAEAGPSPLTAIETAIAVQSFVGGALWAASRPVSPQEPTEGITGQEIAAIVVSCGIKPHDPAYYKLIAALSAAYAVKGEN